MATAPSAQMSAEDCASARVPSSAGKRRAGAAVVEFALVAPLLFLLILGSIEFGRGMMALELVANAAREGARKGCLPGTATKDIQTTITNSLSGTGIPTKNAAVTVMVNNASKDASTAVTDDSITVTITVPLRDVSWLPTSVFLGNANLRGHVVMRRE